MNVDFPFRVDEQGRTASTDEAGHLQDLVAQVLFTTPGERVMRPDFGSGLLALVFEPGGPEVAATTQYLVQGALQRWLGHLLAVESVDVRAEDGTLRVTVAYQVLRTRERVVAELSAAPDGTGGGGP